MTSPEIRRALISVSDKQGLADFARGLAECGVTLLSTGGTARHLQQAAIEVQELSDYTGFPEMMDGRLKTLHPKVFGGILGRPSVPADVAAMEEHAIEPIELVVVNLYPFGATISREGTTVQQAIEQIDIGGPSLVRAAAKNSDFVTVATSPDQYDSILRQIRQNGRTSATLRRELMVAAFAHTAEYDRLIAGYFAGQLEPEPLPRKLYLTLDRKTKLRYGENEHQRAAVYSAGPSQSGSLVSAIQLHGKELSYNNLLDLDSALAVVKSLPHPACAVIKHNNPCGAASAEPLADACRRAMEGDPLSAFGSVLAMNRPVDEPTANFLSRGDFFVEAIAAPAFEDAAVELLTAVPKWKKNVRLVQVGPLTPGASPWEIRSILGGALVQQADDRGDPREKWTVATQAQPDPDTWEELEFAWAMVRHVKSNAIVLTSGRAICGVGAGQMSRVDSAEIAIRKAGPRAAGSCMASDAFFPFADSIEFAVQARIAAIIQPGGSVRDEEVIAACDRAGIPMVLTARRHFKH